MCKCGCISFLDRELFCRRSGSVSGCLILKIKGVWVDFDKRVVENKKCVQTN